MQEDRRDAAEADEDGGGGDEKLFSAAKPLSTGTTRKVAMVSQQMGEEESPAENGREC